MMQDETNPRSDLARRQFVYGALLIGCSFAVAFLLYESGCELMPAVGILLFGVALVVSRWRLFALFITLQLFYSVVLGGMDLGNLPTTRWTTKRGAVIVGRPISNDGRQVVVRKATGVNYSIPLADVINRRVIPASTTSKSLIVLLSLLLLACSFRFCGCLAGDRPSTMLTSRFNYTPVAPARAGGASWHVAEFMSLVSILAAVGISGVLCSPLDQQPRSGPHLGLIPEAYFAIKMVLLLGVLVGASRGVLAYLSMLVDDGSLASLQLRRELWKSNGSEERRIARQMRTTEG